MIKAPHDKILLHNSSRGRGKDDDDDAAVQTNTVERTTHEHIDQTHWHAPGLFHTRETALMSGGLNLNMGGTGTPLFSIVSVSS